MFVRERARERKRASEQASKRGRESEREREREKRERKLSRGRVCVDGTEGGERAGRWVSGRHSVCVFGVGGVDVGWVGE